MNHGGADAPILRRQDGLRAVAIGDDRALDFLGRETREPIDNRRLQTVLRENIPDGLAVAARAGDGTNP